MTTPTVSLPIASFCKCIRILVTPFILSNELLKAAGCVVTKSMMHTSDTPMVVVALPNLYCMTEPIFFFNAQVQSHAVFVGPVVLGPATAIYCSFLNRWFIWQGSSAGLQFE
jgi:hypothetical protein